MSENEHFYIPGAYLKELLNLRIKVKEKDGQVSRGLLVSAGSKFILLRVMIMCHNIASIRVIEDG